VSVELWQVEIEFQRLLESVYSLCLRGSLQVAMGIPTVSLSRRMSAVVLRLASSCAVDLNIAMSRHPDEVDSQMSGHLVKRFAAFRDCF